MKRVSGQASKRASKERQLRTPLYRMIKFASHDNITLQKKLYFKHFRSLSIYSLCFHLFFASCQFSYCLLLIYRQNAQSNSIHTHNILYALCFLLFNSVFFSGSYAACVPFSPFININTQFFIYKNNRISEQRSATTRSLSVSICWKGRRMKVVFL